MPWTVRKEGISGRFLRKKSNLFSRRSLDFMGYENHFLKPKLCDDNLSSLPVLPGVVEVAFGIDKESKSNSFFCCSLYMDERRFFTQKEFVCVCVQYNLCL